MSHCKKGIFILFLALCLVCAGRMIWSLSRMMNTVPTGAELNTLPVIMIDPGHGGIDGGAVGVGDVVEKDINLHISLMMRDIFAVNGFHVVMTRDIDTSIHDDGVEGLRAQKTSDLHNRLAIMNDYPHAIFISVHQNKFGDSSSSGAQVFYSPNNPGSERLAELLQSRIVGNLQPDNHRLAKPAGKNLYLMTEADCTAVLLECGFLSNSEEAQLLMDSEYQAKMAFIAFCGVMEYLELDQPVSTGEVYF